MGNGSKSDFEFYFIHHFLFFLKLTSFFSETVGESKTEKFGETLNFSRALLKNFSKVLAKILF